MIPFSPPYISENAIRRVVEVLESGWITTGPQTRLFEEKLTGYCGHQSTVCLSSASAGLEMVLRWFGVKEGDEVIIPAYTYAATANVVVHCGAKPVFTDIGDDFNITVENIKSAITSKTKVVMPVDLAGYPCDYEAINNLVNESTVRSIFNPGNSIQNKLGRILVLSDAAHSFGAWYKEEHTGKLTDFTVFSFHAVKNLTTAEGGAICINMPPGFDPVEIQRELKIKSLHGQTKDALSKTQSGNWQYDITEAGFKCNMTDIQAALGIAQLEEYDDFILARRKAIFDRYTRILAIHDWALLPEYFNAEKKSSCHVFLLRIKGISSSKRDDLIRFLNRQGISVNVHFIPLPMMSFYRNSGYKMEDYPVSGRLFEQEISLPVYYTLKDEQVDYICGRIADGVKEIL